MAVEINIPPNEDSNFEYRRRLIPNTRTIRRKNTRIEIPNEPSINQTRREQPSARIVEPPPKVDQRA